MATDEERMELARKLDADLEAFVEQKVAEQGPREIVEDNRSIDEIANDLKRHPAFMKEFDPTQPLSAAMEGLQALKYESDSPEDNALSFKEDGNKNFAHRKYRWAMESYTSGITCRCADRQLNAVLHTNRAAAQFHIGNFRSSLNDCIAARKFKPDHFKAIVRGAECCMELKKVDDVIQWCNAGFLIKPDDALLSSLRTKAMKLKKIQDRDVRKAAATERKKDQDEQRLREVIKEHGVQLSSAHSSAAVDDLCPLHPSGQRVHTDQCGTLHWPVMFVYPEHSESDCIASFDENTRFIDHLVQMFPPTVEPPLWDADNKYNIEHLQLFFEDVERERLYKVQATDTLHDTLKHKRYLVHSGTPTFIIVVRDSVFAADLMCKYNC